MDKQNYPEQNSEQLPQLDETQLVQLPSDNAEFNWVDADETAVIPPVPVSEPLVSDTPASLEETAVIAPVDLEQLLSDNAESNWLDEVLSPAHDGSEIGPDEHAVASAGLTHPDDMEVERILQEAKSGQWLSEPTMMIDVPDADTPAEPEGPLHVTQELFRDQEYRDTFGEGNELEQMFENEPVVPAVTPEPEPVEEEPEPAEEEPPMRKGRPKRKKGYGLFGIPHILVTGVWLAIVLAIGVWMGRILWLCAADVLAFGQEPKTVTITITAEDDIHAIAEKLKEADLIRYPQLFAKFAELTGKDERISVGTFYFNRPDEDTGEIPGTIYDYSALINGLSDQSPAREVATVMIPEGYTCAQIFALLEEKNVCTVAELEEYAANGELDEYWFLEGVERGDKYCLEGYLFPDTYDFYTNDDPQRILHKFLNAFEDRFTEKMQENLVTINDQFAAMMKKRGYKQDYIDSHKITIREVVIIASMIEKESAGADESYTISSVIYNRLSNPDFYYLNIDATLIYALGGNIDPETGKTKPLTYADLELDSPYNTYTHMGLTPGPISNPGRESLNAALNPEETDYYYYVFDYEAGESLFSKTEKEHNKKIESLKEKNQ